MWMEILDQAERVGQGQKWILSKGKNVIYKRKVKEDLMQFISSRTASLLVT